MCSAHRFFQDVALLFNTHIYITLLNRSETCTHAQLLQVFMTCQHLKPERGYHLKNFIIISSSHLSLNCGDRWGTTDYFATSFLHFSLFSTALWDLLNSRPVHSLMLSSHLFLCLPCLLPPFTVPCKMVLARPDQRET